MLDSAYFMQFENLERRLKLALDEDCAYDGVTTKQIPGHHRDRITAKILVKQNGVFCGAFLVKPIFRLLDPRVRVKLNVKDGQHVKKGQTAGYVTGTVYALFVGERLFLNLACSLSGIATLTNKFVKAVRPGKAVILGTRKTTPIWRDVEKYAIRCGGGKNHRFSLSDAVLIKDNHLALLRSKGFTPSCVYGVGKKGIGGKKGIKFVQIEAKTYKDVWDGIKMKADIIMLDNMSRRQLKGAITFIEASRKALKTSAPLIEVSGGITLKNIREFVKLGVDRVSVGALTHSSPALDLSMEVVNGH